MSGRNGRNPKSPAFQVYPGDFTSDPKVQAMTVEEVGAYWLLLCAAWIDEGLPNEPAFLARICRMTPEQFERAWKMVGLCWKPGSDNRLRNPRQERERQFQKDSRARRLAASEAANNAKKDRIDAESEPNRSPIDPLTLHPTPVPNAQGPTPDTRIPTPGEKNGAPPRADPEPEPWIAVFAGFPTLNTGPCHAAYRSWVEYRRAAKIKAWPLATLKAALKKFERHGPDAFLHAIEESISNGWQGVFEPKLNGATTHGKSQRRADGTKPGEFAYQGDDPRVI